MELLICTVVGIILLFGYSLYLLITQGKISIISNLIQIILFCLLHSQIYKILGNEHYLHSNNPKWFDWIQFTISHVLRATDIIDFLEEYNINLQNVYHNSVLSGIAIVIMHWIVGVFLISLLFAFVKRNEKINKLLENGENWWKQEVTWGWYWTSTLIDILRSIFKTEIYISRKFVAVILFFLLYLTISFSSNWRFVDTLLLWPLDNVLRVLDAGDAFQIFKWRLHSVEEGQWSSTLAIIFRFWVIVYIGKIINRYQLLIFKGKGLSIKELIEILVNEDCDLEVREESVKALGNLKAKESIDHMISELRWVSDLSNEVLIEGLVSIGPDVIPYAIDELRKNTVMDKTIVVDILRGIGPRADCIGDFVKFLPDYSCDVREEVTNILKKMELGVVSNFINALTKTVKDERTSLKETYKHFYKNYEHLQDEVEDYMFEGAVEILVPMGANVVSILVTALKSNEPLIRRIAVTTLGFIGAEAKCTTPELVKCLSDENVDVQNSAKSALKRINSY